MSGQAEAIPGHPESWSLRKDSGLVSSIGEISGQKTWVSRGDLEDGGSCQGRTLPETNNSHSETKSEGICCSQLLDQKQMQGSISRVDGTAADVNAKKKRHASMSHPGNHKQVGRKRRKTMDRNATHPKFLMGGCITDPLNLNSLCNEEVSRSLNAATPISSPLPHVNKDPNPVIIPIDLRDPLQLNTVCSETDNTASLTRTLAPKSSGKKRKKRCTDKLNESHSADEATIAVGKPPNLTLEGLNIKPQHHASTSKIPDKIVSPVLPESGQSYRKRKKQEPTAKISRALLVEKVDLKPQENSPEKKVPPHNKGRGTPEKRRYKRQTSKETKPQLPKFKDQNKKFQYGNYHRYYGYRNPDHEEDSRIPFLKKKWFEGKTCLDIGCNSGHVTLYVAKTFAPERITGIDIDGVLIGIARKNIRCCLEKERNPEQGKFPTSMEKMYGPVTSTQPAKSPKTTSKFPGNVLFRCANFVPENEDILELQKPEYDTVLCLSVTKWIHLNWGDVGLKRMFRRIFLSLRPGGRLILEPQGWPSYTKKKKLTETIYKNFKQIQLKPEKFKDHLLSSHVGFSSCETIGTPLNKAKGFRRPILMFTKLTTSRASAAEPKAVVVTEHAASPSTTKTESAEPVQVAAPSAVDTKPPAAPHQIPSKPSTAAFPEKESDARPTVDPRPQGCPANGDQAAHRDAGKDAKLEKSESLTTEGLSCKRKVENEVAEGDYAKKVIDTSRNEEPEGPPSKKIKTEPTD